MIVDYDDSKNYNKVEQSVENKNPSQEHKEKLLAIEAALNDYKKRGQFKFGT
jgi:hypothetical protein